MALQYRILTAPSLEGLVKEVNDLLKLWDCWEPSGSPFMIPVTAGWGYGYKAPIHADDQFISVEFGQAMVQTD